MEETDESSPEVHYSAEGVFVRAHALQLFPWPLSSQLRRAEAFGALKGQVVCHQGQKHLQQVVYVRLLAEQVAPGHQDYWQVLLIVVYSVVVLDCLWACHGVHSARRN